MKIKLAVFVALVAFVGLAFQTGCNKKKEEGTSGKAASASSGDMCTNACTKMKECSDAFAEAVLKGMPDELKAKAKAQMKQQYADLEKCKQQCATSKNKEQDKKLMEKCLGKKDCKAFAECVMAEAKKNAHHPPKAPQAMGTKGPAAGTMAPAAGTMAPAAGAMAPAAGAMAPAAGAMTAPKK